MTNVKLPRRRFLRLVAGGAALTAASGPLRAQTYPARPIMMIVPFLAGGPTDTVARIVAEGMRGTLDQPVIVEDVPGADGTIGVRRAARAAPDGYTLSFGQSGTHVLNGAVYPLDYDCLTDFAPISLLTSNPYVLVTRKDLPPQDVRELIAWIKSKQSGSTVGVASTTQRVIVAYFRNLTGTKLQLVPYRGGAAAIQDMIAGTIDLYFDQPATALPQLRAGNTKAYAVTSKNRFESLPDIPSFNEVGVTGFDISVWHAVWAPKATPMDVIAKLNRAVVGALADAHIRTRMAELGVELPPRDQQTPEALRVYQRAEIEKWWPIIKAAGIKAE
jgi:tripartite-type tricarboxylate transporter receptor subunit TctC